MPAEVSTPRPPAGAASWAVPSAPDDVQSARLRAASVQLEEARRALRARRDAVQQARRRILVIDELLTDLEEMHLRGSQPVGPELRRRVRTVEAEAGVALPRRVLRARDTARLHSAVLDWQEQVLDATVPARRELPDVHDRA